MSLKQQINKLTRSIRQQKEQRQRLRKLFIREKATRANGCEIVEFVCDKLRSRDAPVTVEEWSELVKTYVKLVLGHDSAIVGNYGESGLYVRWSSVKGEDRQMQHCVYVHPDGSAVNLYHVEQGAGGGYGFHLAKDPVKDWPL